MSIYNFQFTKNDGSTVNLKDFEGKVLLLVNTASKCGFTYQYEGLEKLNKQYKDKGLVIIGFPCNQFGEQEPGTDAEIASFCKATYDVDFMMAKKLNVRDAEIHPLFKYLTEQTTFKGFSGEKAEMLTNHLKANFPESYMQDNQIKWNFTKFLVDKTGKIVERFEPTVDPEIIATEIEKLL